MWKTFNVGHYAQTFQQSSFIPAMLTGAIDFYHFIPLSLTLTLARGHTVSTKQNLLKFFGFFCIFFQLNGVKYGIVMKYSS